LPLMQQVNLGIIGAGTVGGGVYQAIQKNGGLMACRFGVRLEIAKIATRDLKKPRSVKIPAKLLTTDWQSVVDDPRVNIVVELIGGTTTAREITLRALRQGKPVVMANKALLSAHGEELFSTAQNFGTNLYYEASVAGGIPIIKVLREGLIAESEMRSHPMRNFVECCLGGDVPLPDMSVTARIKLEPDDVLLVCTDGLWSGLDDSDFGSASRDERTPLDTMLRSLAERAVANNAPHSDNTSVAAARWRGP